MQQDHRKISQKTSMGVFLLEISRKGLYAVRFLRQDPFSKPGFEMGLKVFGRYFKNPRVRFDSLRLDLTGLTPFQLKVYAVLRKVSAGKVITYGELAKRAGYPGAARAVGSAMKKNRLPIVIPCHRVICSDGSLGQYSAGFKWKRWLLEHEKFFAQRQRF